MYDPSTARFLTKDPIEDTGGSPNLYLYCFNDPVNRTDPSGNEPQPGLVIPVAEQIQWERIAKAVSLNTGRRISFNFAPFSGGYVRVGVPKEAQDIPAYEAVAYQLGLRGLTGKQRGEVLGELYLGGIAAANPDHANYRVASLSGEPIRLDPSSLARGSTFFAQDDGSVLVFGGEHLLGVMWPVEGSQQWELLVRGFATVSLPLDPRKSGEDARRAVDAMFDRFTAPSKPKPLSDVSDLSWRFSNTCIGAGPKPAANFPPLCDYTKLPSAPVRPVVNYFREETKAFLKSRPSTPVVHAAGKANYATAVSSIRAEDITAGIEFMRQKMADQFQTMTPGDILFAERAIPMTVGGIVAELDRERRGRDYEDYRRDVLNPLLWERWDREFERFALLEQLATTGPGPGGSGGRAASRSGSRRRSSKPIVMEGNRAIYDGNKYDNLAKALEKARNDVMESTKSEPAKEPEPSKPAVDPTPAQAGAEPPKEPAKASVEPQKARTFTLEEARKEYGNGELVGVIELTPDGGWKVTAGTRALHGNHSTVGELLGPRVGVRYGFNVSESGEVGVWLNSSAGGRPTEADVPRIRLALRSNGYLAANKLHRIQTTESIDAQNNPAGRRLTINLVTDEVLSGLK